MLEQDRDDRDEVGLRGAGRTVTLVTTRSDLQLPLEALVRVSLCL